jgi:hypothetical protein
MLTCTVKIDENGFEVIEVESSEDDVSDYESETESLTLVVKQVPALKTELMVRFPMEIQGSEKDEGSESSFDSDTNLLDQFLKDDAWYRQLEHSDRASYMAALKQGSSNYQRPVSPSTYVPGEESSPKTVFGIKPKTSPQKPVGFNGYQPLGQLDFHIGSKTLRRDDPQLKSPMVRPGEGPTRHEHEKGRESWLAWLLPSFYKKPQAGKAPTLPVKQSAMHRLVRREKGPLMF